MLDQNIDSLNSFELSKFEKASKTNPKFECVAINYLKNVDNIKMKKAGKSGCNSLKISL